jgi:hypothetical protein
MGKGRQESPIYRVKTRRCTIVDYEWGQLFLKNAG